MTNNKTNNDEIKFENQDLQIFNIPEPQLKVVTLQNYFFPRLGRLLDDTLSLAREIYGESILEDFTLAYMPSNRPSTKIPRVYDVVLAGLSGKRKKEPLIVKNKENKPYLLTPAYIHYVLQKSGEMRVLARVHKSFCINETVNEHFRKLVADIFAREKKSLQMLFIASAISWAPYRYKFQPLHQVVGEQLASLHLCSQSFYLPVDGNRGLRDLQLAFITLMPIWYAINQIARTGEEKYFSQHLDSLIEYYKTLNVADAGGDNVDDENADEVDRSLPDSLDSYEFVRARKWYHILARDNWTCKCGRSSLKDGVTLHVDHIMPRSKGGTDDDDNLRTLCQKYNLGKSDIVDTN